MWGVVSGEWGVRFLVDEVGVSVFLGDEVGIDDCLILGLNCVL